jgi:hypothetical protein
MNARLATFLAGHSTSPTIYTLAARFAAITVSIWSALLGLVIPSSLTSRVQDAAGAASIVVDGLHWGVILVCVIGLADIVWHDLGGKKIWPSLSSRRRHVICVMGYASLGAVWLIKSFVAAASGVNGSHLLSLYGISMAMVCGMVTVAIALEVR